MHESDLNESAVIGPRENFAGGGPLHMPTAILGPNGYFKS